MLEKHSKRTLSRALPAGADLTFGPRVVRVKGKYLISSSDPITGAVERAGWHAVNVSANDVATTGVMPEALTVVILTPEKTEEAIIKQITSEIRQAATGLGIMYSDPQVVVSRSLLRSITIVTAFGSGDRFVTSSDSKEGDSILMTKTAGIEGTSILSRLTSVLKLVGEETAEKGSSLVNDLSILKEARIAFSTNRVHAMHDATEGGIVGSVLEMSLASKLGFELNCDLVPVDDSTKITCAKLGVDPLRLIGSGTLLIACPRASSNQIAEALKIQGVRCTEIGRFRNSNFGRWLIRQGRRTKLIQNSVQDELWSVLEKYESAQRQLRENRHFS